MNWNKRRVNGFLTHPRLQNRSVNSPAYLLLCLETGRISSRLLPRAAAMTRTTRSRSVTTPINLSPSETGKKTMLLLASRGLP